MPLKIDKIRPDTRVLVTVTHQSTEVSQDRSTIKAFRKANKTKSFPAQEYCLFIVYSPYVHVTKYIAQKRKIKGLMKPIRSIMRRWSSILRASGRYQPKLQYNDMRPMRCVVCLFTLPQTYWCCIITLSSDAAITVKQLVASSSSSSPSAVFSSSLSPASDAWRKFRDVNEARHYEVKA